MSNFELIDNHELNFWNEIENRLIRKVVKRDGTSVDKAYFMATHMPFGKLEVIRGGAKESSPEYATEEEIYSNLLTKPDNEYQMVMVRGDNGTGKSHFICWLYYKYLSSEYYNPDVEKVIFLERLQNSARGAIRQFLEKDIVVDEKIKEKFQRFLDSNSGMSPEHFKSEIYSSYLNLIEHYSQQRPLSKAKRKDMVAFFRDKYITDYMLRDDGPIDRCYKMINDGIGSEGKNQDTNIFKKEDFIFPEYVLDEFDKNTSEYARQFYDNQLMVYMQTTETRGSKISFDDFLVFINRFTSQVMQECANISSDEAKQLFVDLRKQLQKENKRLTVFIEDFTSFGIIESELIVALQAESGGEHGQLCPVKTFIGITDWYYNGIQDNFKDRVTLQIIVKPQSFSDDNFLCGMTARYLNALRCDPKELEEWAVNGYDESNLPIVESMPAFEWDSYTLNEKKVSLFPFNKRAIVGLHERLLLGQQPRYFLIYIFQNFMDQYIQFMKGKKLLLANFLSKNFVNKDVKSSYNATIQSLNLDDVSEKNLRIVISNWGDGTLDEQNDKISDLPKAFFSHLSISVKGEKAGGRKQESSPEPQKKDPKDIALEERLEDISNWINDNKTLSYFKKYRDLLRNFVRYAIPWQDEGLPVFLAKDRFESHSDNLVYIEGSGNNIDKSKAVIVLEHSRKSQTILEALVYFDRYGDWTFEDADYYQQHLINWIAQDKSYIKSKLLGHDYATSNVNIMKMSLTAKYLLLLLQNKEFDKNNDLTKLLLSSTITNWDYNTTENEVWNDMQIYIKNNKLKLDRFSLLLQNSNTALGVLGEGASMGGVAFYRAQELKNILNELVSKHWDIRQEFDKLTAIPSINLIIDDFKKIYTEIDKIVKIEKESGKKILEHLKNIIGEYPSKDNLEELYGEASNFIIACRIQGKYIDPKVENRFADKSKRKSYADMLMGYINIISKGIECDNCVEAFEFFAGTPVSKLKLYSQELGTLDKLTEEVVPKQTTVITVNNNTINSINNKIAEINGIIGGESC